MRALFLDCSLGAAGDMIAAALLELCPDREAALARLNAIGIPGVEYSLESVRRCGVTGSHMKVTYLGNEEGELTQDGHHHRNLGEVLAIVSALNLPENVKSAVQKVYSSIAEAEGEVHGRESGEVHFHELGAMDAIADISAVCLLADMLEAEHITVSPVCTGFGTVRCAHGLMPVPAPATALLLRSVPSFAGDMEGELCTPTGAALAAHLASGFGHMPEMTAERVGCGMGSRDFGRLSCVRAFIGNSEESIIELCCNLDDMSPEAVGFALDELLRAGAPDAYYEPIGMKKNRPGVLLTCLCSESQRDEMVELIFRHTSTLGIRETLCRRYVLHREERTVITPFGQVRVKLSEGYGAQRKKAEYEDLAKIARENKLTLEDVRRLVGGEREQ